MPNSTRPKIRHLLLPVAVQLAFVITIVTGRVSASSPSTSPSSSLNTLSSAPPQAQKLVISSHGINVPKRPTIIAGLNQQFNRASNSTKVGGLLAAAVGGFSSSPLASLMNVGSKVSPSRLNASSLAPSNLYLDRHQQELLAANPTISLSNSTNVLTRSDVPGGPPSSIEVTSITLSGANQKSIGSGFGLGASSQLQQPDVAAASQQQHSYRGYSLIELEVKSESDRRYVQELYGNLSAALNEQAQRPSAFPPVSPYVDIDFWSFKSALNDQIDIMVSPKSRAFILNQLARARVKHRVKIEDIQTKLDQQQPLQLQQAELSGRHWSGLDQSGSGKQQTAADQQLNGRLQPLVDSQAGTANMNDSLFFENYHRLADINQYLESIVARARDIARVQVIGRSSQGRYLRVLRLGYEQSDLDGSTGPLASSHFSARSSTNSEDENSPDLKPKLQPAQQNASTILDQFFKRQRSVKKLGSIWFDGGTHAREWISPATVLYMSFRLADNHAKCLRFFDYLQVVASQGASSRRARSPSSGRSDSTNPQLDNDLLNGINEINTSLLSGYQGSVKPRPRTEFEQKLELLAKRPQEVASEHACDLELEQLLRRYTFYIMPVLNPDGYEYSHTHNRLWRKTRSTSNHPIYRHFCLGVDPNRNYDARHGYTGSSSHPCSQTYGGTTPFTEPETRHQSNFVYAHRDTLKMFISFHSYSQMILLPFSHSKQLAPDHKDLESVGQAAVKAIERTHGTQYRVGASAAILYTASGTASDWAYEKAGIKYSYTIELRDTGTYGFLLPRNQIIPTGEETFNGLLAMISQMETNDNLLTSKSAPTLNSTERLDSTAGLVHAPDLDQLRPFGRFRPKPAQLENALDGSDTWATPEPRAPGVRDRTPISSHSRINDGFDSSSSSAHANNNRNVLEDETISMSDEEPDAGLAFEGEGELMEPTNNLSVNSALNGQSSESAAELAAKLMSHDYAQGSSVASDRAAVELLGRRMSSLASTSSSSLSGQSAHSVRQRLGNQQLSISANGRSLINHLPPRTGSNSPRREFSNEFVVASAAM